MPNIKSAIKRAKSSEKRRLQNASQKSALRTAIKSVEVAINNSDATVASDAFHVASKKIDKAVSKGLLHKNAAARKKSRLAKRINALSVQA